MAREPPGARGTGTAVTRRTAFFLLQSENARGRGWGGGLNVFDTISFLEQRRRVTPGGLKFLMLTTSPIIEFVAKHERGTFMILSIKPEHDRHP